MQRQSVRDLPANKNPVGTRCIQIEIPDDDEWERDLYGEVWRLTRWMLWERDITKSGKPVADIWLKAIESWKHCDGSPTPFQHGTEVDFDMPGLRVDCDCNVWITCCDGTEKQLLTADQVQALINPTSPTTPVPQPGGHCQTYSTTMIGSDGYLVPGTLNAGDTIHVSNFSGATREGGALFWYGPQGLQFFNNAYLPNTTFTDPTDPVPTAPHQSLVLHLGGVYYELVSGTFTVPGGVTNQQGTIVLNTSTAGDLLGTVGFDVEVCNNQALSWSHTFDFTINSFGDLFTFPTHGYLNGPLGFWSPGVGYVNAYQTASDGKGFSGILMSLVQVIDYFEVRCDFTYVSGSYASVSTNYSFEYNYYPGPTSHNQVVLPTVPNSPQIDPIPISSTNLEVQILAGLRDDGADPGGSVVLTSIRISGTGTDPFV